MPVPRADYVTLIAAVPEIDIARLAAYIDGEGTIYINRQGKMCGGMKSPRYFLSLIISNTDPRLMSWLKQTFDGSVYGVNFKCVTSHLGKKKILRWQVNERIAYHVLKACLPFMIMKKQQAEVGIAFMGLKQKREITMRDHLGRIRREPLSDAEIAQRHAMKLEIERLNGQTHDLGTIQ